MHKNAILQKNFKNAKKKPGKCKMQKNSINLKTHENSENSQSIAALF
jgi:hypothetical protein